MTEELAPDRCITCSKPRPEVDTAKTWAYIAGGVPLGAMACCQACLEVAVHRFNTTGRLDGRPAKDGAS